MTQISDLFFIGEKRAEDFLFQLMQNICSLFLKIWQEICRKMLYNKTKDV